MARTCARFQSGIVCRENNQRRGKTCTDQECAPSGIVVQEITSDEPSGRLTQTKLPERRRSVGVREAERLLRIPRCRTPNSRDLSLHVDAQLPGEHRAIFIEVGGAAETFEEEIGKEPMLAWLIRLRFLQGGIPHQQHHPLLIPVGNLRDPLWLGHASGI